MKIALLGYGKMGHAIEEIAHQQGHSVVCRISIDNLEDRTTENIRKADVAIEFSSPESAYDNLVLCLDARVPVVCGSTGWLSRFDDIKQYCAGKKGGLLYASNFSVGVNIFFAINRKLAELMKGHGYDVTMKEIHHTAKRDAPSGTAISLAEQILAVRDAKTNWVNQPSANPADLVIESERTDPAPGTHIVAYTSPVDDITITHTAHSRRGFASGAVLAAAFLNEHREGIYDMSDVLGIK